MGFVVSSQKLHKDKINMAYNISKIPVIVKRSLDDDNFTLKLNTESKKIVIKAIMQDEHMIDGSENKISLSRPKAIFRDRGDEQLDYTNAINKLLPDDDEVTWINPMKTFKSKLMELIKEDIQKVDSETESKISSPNFPHV